MKILIHLLDTVIIAASCAVGACIVITLYFLIP